MLRLGSPLSTSVSSLRSSSPLRRSSVPGSPSVLSKAKSSGGKGRRRFTCWRCVAAGMLGLVALLAAEQFSSRSLFLDFSTLDKLAEKSLQGAEGGGAEGDPRLLEGRGSGGALRMRLQEQRGGWGNGGMGIGGFAGGGMQGGFGGVQSGGDWKARMATQQQGGMNSQGGLMGGAQDARWQDGRQAQGRMRADGQGFEQDRQQQEQQQQVLPQQEMQMQVPLQQQQQLQQQRGGEEAAGEEGAVEENCDECRAEVTRLLGLYGPYSQRRAQMYGARRRLLALPHALTACLPPHIIANLSLLLTASQPLKSPNGPSLEAPGQDESADRDGDVPASRGRRGEHGHLRTAQGTDARRLESRWRIRDMEEGGSRESGAVVALGADGHERDSWSAGGELTARERREDESSLGLGGTRLLGRMVGEEEGEDADWMEEGADGGRGDGEGAGMAGGGRRLLKASPVDVLQAKLVTVQSDIDDLKAKIDSVKASLEEQAQAMQRVKDFLYDQGDWAPKLLTEKAHNRTVSMLEQQCVLALKDKAGNAVKQANMPPQRPTSWKGYYCQASPAELAKYHKYRPHRQCPDDWFFVQDLLYAKDCFHLPIRNCFARAPTNPSEPLPFPQSLFDQRALKDENVRWGSHHCKSFACLNARALGDCRNCFNLTLESYRWQRAYRGSQTMADVIKLKRGALRLGLDAGGGTGSFAAHMARYNVTVLTTAMNSETVNGNYGGLPYMETIALRGLIPLFVPHKARLPFYDNTLDIIHSVNSVKYLPILDFEELVFEWDRVLRPGGIVWFEMFYAPVDEMPLYVAVIDLLRYRRLKWGFSPKPESGERKGFHLYLNAVIEKPARPDPGSAAARTAAGTAGGGVTAAAAAAAAGAAKKAAVASRRGAQGGKSVATTDRRKGASIGVVAKGGNKGPVVEKGRGGKGVPAVPAAAGGKGRTGGAQGKKGGAPATADAIVTDAVMSRSGRKSLWHLFRAALFPPKGRPRKASRLPDRPSSPHASDSSVTRASPSHRAAAGGAGCGAGEDGGGAAGNMAAEVQLAVGGMACAACAASIEKALMRVDGVSRAVVSVVNGRARVTFNNMKTNADDIAAAVEDAGFEVTAMDDPLSAAAALHPVGGARPCRLRIPDLLLVSSAGSLEEMLQGHAGVLSAIVSLSTAEAHVVLDSTALSPADLLAAVHHAGFPSAHLIDDSAASADAPQAHTLRYRLHGLAAAAASALPVRSPAGGNGSPRGSATGSARAAPLPLPARIEAVLCALPGVSAAAVHAESETAAVTFDPDRTGARDILEALQAEVAGVGGVAKVELAESEGGGVGGSAGAKEREQEVRKLWRQFVWSLVFTVPVFLLAMVLNHIPPFDAWLMTPVINSLPIGMLLRGLLTAPVQFVVGWRFYTGAFYALRRRAANMDVLVAMGTNAAFFYSSFALIASAATPLPSPSPSPAGSAGAPPSAATAAATSGGGAVAHVARMIMEGMEGGGEASASASVSAYAGVDFFETSAMLISFIVLGKYLEAVARGRTSDAIGKLLNLAPATAVLLSVDTSSQGGAERAEQGSAAGGGEGNGEGEEEQLIGETGEGMRVVGEREIEAALIQRGDIIRVAPGGKMPVDGVVVWGHTYANESMVTGEARPVLKEVGSAVIGGTLNLGGSVHVRATRVGGETALAQIVKLVEAAQMAKAPIQRVADQISAVFVPTVVLLALVVFLAWLITGYLGTYPASWLPTGMTPFELALQFGIAVLVIACPCALGLATPTAVMVATGVGAQQGILIKGADALERAHKIEAVVFDKTGTLTQGKPSVTATALFTSRLAMPDLLALLAAAEANSEHPLAKAIADYCMHSPLLPSLLPSLSHIPLPPLPLPPSASASSSTSSFSKAPPSLPLSPPPSPPSSPPPLLPLSHPGTAVELCSFSSGPSTAAPAHNVTNGSSSSNRGGLSSLPPVDSFHSIPGHGIICQISGRHVAVGNLKLMRGPPTIDPSSEPSPTALPCTTPLPVPARAEQWLEEVQADAQTGVLVALDGEVVAGVAVSDPVKPEAAPVVALLKAMGMHPVLVTGDNWGAARAVARAVGIADSDVVAEAVPQHKAEYVRQRQAEGQQVAMVGDGVNDSPALVAADVGMAIGAGTDIAIEAADVVLMRSSLEDVITAVHLARTALTRIRLNYVWALGYNVLGIPIAAGVLFPTPLHFRLPPWIAGAAMALSSVSVVCSSLLLRRYKRPAKLDLIALQVQG
ncbi:unnamed protein product [Closterium sp. NIES-65]|nr:unnamed protein product [Closterium sp. NIES-65]